MVANVLKPNVQDLQGDAIELLEEIADLMDRASNTLSSDKSGEKYGGFRKEIKDATQNVKDLELRMAVVAPMKAGKSTIINAISGLDLLPSRNAAMTTLPTEIIFNADLKEPRLILSDEIQKVFQETLSDLNLQIKELGTERMQEKMAQYPHLMDLLQEIKDTQGLIVYQEISGREKIVKVLTGLNDIIRLCSVIDPTKDPLARLVDVPRLETPFWRSQETTQSEKLGNLVIIDTPGPNEAGEHLRLTAVVAEQLQKSSIVLIVLDFTQLNNKAAEEVKKQVQPIINLIGKENLYVLVNKVDQRRKGDMTPEQVKEFVFADLGLSQKGDTDRVFEIAAIKAFCATKFLWEVQQHPNLNIDEMETVEALAKEALGARWEAKLKKTTLEDLQEEAEFLWEDSGFAPFLEKAINALMESAAPRCMLSALNLSRNRLLELRDDVKLRSSAIAKDEEKLRLEVDALEADLKRLEVCYNDLKKVDLIKAQLYQELNKTLEELQRNAKLSVQNFYEEEEYNRANWLDKPIIAVKNVKPVKNILNLLTNLTGGKMVSDNSNILEFNHENEAELFINKAVDYARRRSEQHLANVRAKIIKKVEVTRTDLTRNLEAKTKPIIERAKARLNETFDVDLDLPPPSLSSNDDFTIINRPGVKNNTRYIDQGYETKIVKKRDLWHWLWIVPYEEKQQVKKPDKQVDYYTVSLEELIDHVNTSIEAGVQNIKTAITKYLDEDFKQRIDTFFQGLDDYLSNYRDSLRQAQQDQQLSIQEKNKLKEDFKVLIPEAKQKIDKANMYFGRIEETFKDHLKSL